MAAIKDERVRSGPVRRKASATKSACAIHENDAFQPVKLLHKQHHALVNARSVATRIFTKAEHADMHCQMGNLNLAMFEIEAWLSTKLDVNV